MIGKMHVISQCVPNYGKVCKSQESKEEGFILTNIKQKLHFWLFSLFNSFLYIGGVKEENEGMLRLVDHKQQHQHHQQQQLQQQTASQPQYEQLRQQLPQSSSWS